MMNNPRIRLLILIRSLESGGAQRQLIELCKAIDNTLFSVVVATFYDGGSLRPELEAIEGVTLLSLRKKGRWDVLLFLFRLWYTTRRIKPDIVHGYMGTANELGLITGRAVGAKVVWGIRASNMDLSRYDWLSVWGYRVGIWFSRFSDLIIANSYAGKAHHVAQGYPSDRFAIIQNGIDTQYFDVNPHARQQMRRQWGVNDNDNLIGLVGRLDPIKDHPTFLRAAALLVQERTDVRFVCAGDGPSTYKQELEALAERLNLTGRVIWAGACSDMIAVYNALDIGTSSSYGEGFSNVIAEAMACGVPCVVTDVGDSARIVGDSGMVVAPQNPQAIASVWTNILEMLNEERVILSGSVRERIVREYSVQTLARKTEALLMGLLP